MYIACKVLKVLARSSVYFDHKLKVECRVDLILLQLLGSFDLWPSSLRREQLFCFPLALRKQKWYLL